MRHHTKPNNPLIQGELQNGWLLLYRQHRRTTIWKKKTFGTTWPLHNVIRVGVRFIPHASGRAHIIPYPRSMPRRMDHVVCPTQFRVHYAYKYICIHRIDNILAFITILSWSVFYNNVWFMNRKKTYSFSISPHKDRQRKRTKFTIVFPIWNEEPSLLCINVRLVCHNWNKKTYSHCDWSYQANKKNLNSQTHPFFLCLNE